MKKITLKNGKTAIIRRAEKSDAGAMLEFLDKISRESDFLTFGAGEFNATLEIEENIIENMSKKSNALFIVAEVDGRIVGNLSFAGGARPRIAHIGEFGVSVLKEYWGQGIGTKLIEYLIDWSRQAGIRKINLRVRIDNYAAIHVYHKLGFRIEGIITRDFLIDGKFYDSMMMGLFID